MLFSILSSINSELNLGELPYIGDEKVRPKAKRKRKMVISTFNN